MTAVEDLLENFQRSERISPDPESACLGGTDSPGIGLRVEKTRWGGYLINYSISISDWLENKGMVYAVIFSDGDYGKIPNAFFPLWPNDAWTRAGSPFYLITYHFEISNSIDLERIIILATSRTDSFLALLSDFDVSEDFCEYDGTENFSWDFEAPEK